MMIKKKKHAGFIFVSEFLYREYTHLSPALGGRGSVTLSPTMLYMNGMKGSGVGRPQKGTFLVQEKDGKGLN